MFRIAGILVLILLAVTVLRTVMSLLSQFMRTAGSTAPRPTAEGDPAGPKSSELRRDPVCGTYVSTHSTVRKLVNGEVLYFCSPECRDKFV